MEIKNIETFYNGYKFRSRLEARWAVFFDDADIMYEYEPEGFNLNGEWYLPDFYLPEYKVYIEIKPAGEIKKENSKVWEEKCAKFRDCTGKAILLCYGDPAERGYSHILFAYDLCDTNGGSGDYYCGFATHEHRAVLVVEPQRSDREIFVVSDGMYHESPKVGAANQFAGDDAPVLWGKASKNIDFEKPRKDIVTDASIKARQARFEYGQHPGRR